MFQTLTFYHSLMRWLVLVALVASIARSWSGYKRGKRFTTADNALRHWTATIAHVQLMIGIVLYTQSPIVSYFWRNVGMAVYEKELLFFSLLHIALMIVAIVAITVGSAMAKRKTRDKDKFKMMLVWYGAAIVIIFIAIPWPFSPLAHRPFFR